MKRYFIRDVETGFFLSQTISGEQLLKYTMTYIPDELSANCKRVDCERRWPLKKFAVVCVEFPDDGIPWL